MIRRFVPLGTMRMVSERVSMINCKVLSETYVVLKIVFARAVGIKIEYKCKFALNKQTSYLSGSRHHPTEIAVKFE